MKLTIVMEHEIEPATNSCCGGCHYVDYDSQQIDIRCELFNVQLRWSESEGVSSAMRTDACIQSAVVRVEAHETPAISLYTELLLNGYLVDHHESDLYVKNAPGVVELIKKHGFGYTPFRSNDIEWFDVPFAYEPFWVKKAEERTRPGVLAQERVRDKAEEGRLGARRRSDT